MTGCVAWSGGEPASGSGSGRSLPGRGSLMSRLLVAALIPACLALPLAAQVPSPSRQVVLDSLARTLRRLDDSTAFHGVVLLAEGNRIAHHSAHGLAHRGYGIPNRPDMAFNMASVGKLYTAVSIGQLVAAGKLRWTDTLATLLPDYPDRDIARRVTVEQLLTHRSGFGLYWTRLFATNWPSLRTARDLLGVIQGDTLLFAPGTQWEYSNSGFAILALIVERLSGQPFPEYVRDHILRPAGMDLNAYTPLDVDVPNRAVGYYREDDGSLRNNLFVHTVVGSGAGGSWASAPDLLRFAQALERGALLDSLTLATMTTPHTDTKMTPWGYGYGFMTLTLRGHALVGHTGGFAGIVAFFLMEPARGRVMVVLSNDDSTNVADRVWAVARLYLVAPD